MVQPVHLKDVTDVEILQEIQDSFSKATGLAAVTVDYKGRPITKYSNFTKFCKKIRQNGKCLEACHRSDAYGGLEAARRERPYIYRCHTGLVDFAIPIIINGLYMGSIMAGQVKIEDSELDRLDLIIKEIPEWREREDLMEAYEEVPVISFDKLHGAAQMMFLVTNSIVEKDMTRRIQEELNLNQKKLMEEVKARAELERVLKDTEIRALQSQINPHFLFNVLNTIGRLALIENAPETQEIVYSLAEILRYVLKSINKMVTIEEEMAHIQRYFKIQSARFGERMCYEMDIQDEIKKFEIPAMSIHALAENAINHGLEPKGTPGHIKISAYAADEHIIIDIVDDGVGMPPETLASLMDLEGSDQENVAGIGINSVNKRLNYHYGPECKLEIQSAVDEGTKVRVKIPIKTNMRRAEHAKGAISG